MVTYLKISDLPVATEAGGADELEVNQSGLTRKITIDQVADVVAPIVADILPPPSTDWGDITSKPDFNALYVNTAGDTMTGPLTGTSATFSTAVSTPIVTSSATLVLNAPTASQINLRINNATVVGTNATNFYPAVTNAVALGSAALRWSNVYAVLGDFTGALTGTSATFSGNISAKNTVTVYGPGGVNSGIVSHNDAAFSIRSQTAMPLYLGAGGSTYAYVATNGTLGPFADGTQSLGAAANRWGNFYTVNATLTGTLTGTTAAMSGNIITNGGYVMIDRTGDALPADIHIRADVGQTADIFFDTTNTHRWGLIKNQTAEGGSNAGSDFHIWAYSDAGASIGSALSITRSTRAVTLAGALTGTTAAFSGNITNSTTNLKFGDLSTGAGIGGDNANVAVRAYATGGIHFQAAAGGTSWANITSTGLTSTVPLTGTTATFSGAVTSVTAAPGTNTTQLASTAFVQAALTNTYQTVSFQTGAVATGTTQLPFDDTIPQITEGDEYMTLAITPKSATSKLVIEVVWNGYNDSATGFQLSAALFRDAVANALAVVSPSTAVGAVVAINFKHTMTSGTTSAITFRVRVGANIAGTTTFNGAGGARQFGGVCASSIVIREVAP